MALYFPGPAASVSLRVSRSTRIETGGSQTWSAWVRRRGNAGTYGLVMWKLINDGGTGPYMSFALYFESASAIAAGVGQSGTLWPFAGPYTLPLDKWVHVLATFDRTGQLVSLYIDGVLVDTTATANADMAQDASATGDVNIGSYYLSDDNEVNCDLGWVCHWKALLGAGEIAALGLGADPRAIRPGALGLCVPMVGGDISDVAGRHHLARARGAPAPVNDPPVRVLGRRRRIVASPSAGGTSILRQMQQQGLFVGSHV